jgi:hypothetical protein
LTLSKKFDEALDALPPGPGDARAEEDGRAVEAEFLAVDGLGARIGRLRLRQSRGGDVRRQAEALPEQMKILGDVPRPVEVEGSLGGAILRSSPDPADQERFWEIRIAEGGREAGLERFRVEGPERERRREPFCVTREQLARIVEGLARGLEAGAEETERS